jgi:hypothetical protein
MLITQPSNIDYLIDDVRLRLGDYNGTSYSNTVTRTSILAGIKYLQRKWHNKYQVLTEEMIRIPAVSGQIYAATLEGDAYIPEINTNDVFRNPFGSFDQTSPPIIAQSDEEVIILAALYFMTLASFTSSSSSFERWSTEDVSYSNIEASRAQQIALSQIKKDLDEALRQRMAQSQVGYFARQYDIGYNEQQSSIIQV